MKRILFALGFVIVLTCFIVLIAATMFKKAPEYGEIKFSSPIEGFEMRDNTTYFEWDVNDNVKIGDQPSMVWEKDNKRSLMVEASEDYTTIKINTDIYQYRYNKGGWAVFERKDKR